MSYWPFILYGLAAYMALRTLIAMVASHKQEHLDELILAERAHRKAAKKAAELAADAEKLASHRDEDDATREARLNDTISAA